MKKILFFGTLSIVIFNIACNLGGGAGACNTLSVANCSQRADCGIFQNQAGTDVCLKKLPPTTMCGAIADRDECNIKNRIPNQECIFSKLVRGTTTTEMCIEVQTGHCEDLPPDACYEDAKKGQKCINVGEWRNVNVLACQSEASKKGSCGDLMSQKECELRLLHDENDGPCKWSTNACVQTKKITPAEFTTEIKNIFAMKEPQEKAEALNTLASEFRTQGAAQLLAKNDQGQTLAHELMKAKDISDQLYATFCTLIDNTNEIGLKSPLLTEKDNDGNTILHLLAEDFKQKTVSLEALSQLINRALVAGDKMDEPRNDHKTPLQLASHNEDFMTAWLDAILKVPLKISDLPEDFLNESVWKMQQFSLLDKSINGLSYEKTLLQKSMDEFAENFYANGILCKNLYKSLPNFKSQADRLYLEKSKLDEPLKTAKANLDRFFQMTRTWGVSLPESENVTFAHHMKIALAKGEDFRSLGYVLWRIATRPLKEEQVNALIDAVAGNEDALKVKLWFLEAEGKDNLNRAKEALRKLTVEDLEKDDTFLKVSYTAESADETFKSLAPKYFNLVMANLPFKLANDQLADVFGKLLQKNPELAKTARADSNTPIWYAISNLYLKAKLPHICGNSKVLILAHLLKNGVSPTATMTPGFSALDLAPQQLPREFFNDWLKAIFITDAEGEAFLSIDRKKESAQEWLAYVNKYRTGGRDKFAQQLLSDIKNQELAKAMISALTADYEKKTMFKKALLKASVLGKNEQASMSLWNNPSAWGLQEGDIFKKDLVGPYLSWEGELKERHPFSVLLLLVNSIRRPNEHEGNYIINEKRRHLTTEFERIVRLNETVSEYRKKEYFNHLLGKHSYDPAYFWALVNQAFKLASELGPHLNALEEERLRGKAFEFLLAWNKMDEALSKGKDGIDNLLKQKAQFLRAFRENGVKLPTTDPETIAKAFEKLFVLALRPIDRQQIYACLYELILNLKGQHKSVDDTMKAITEIFNKNSLPLFQAKLLVRIAYNDSEGIKEDINASFNEAFAREEISSIVSALLPELVAKQIADSDELTKLLGPFQLNQGCQDALLSSQKITEDQNVRDKFNDPKYPILQKLFELFPAIPANKPKIEGMCNGQYNILTGATTAGNNVGELSKTEKQN